MAGLAGVDLPRYRMFALETFLQDVRYGLRQLRRSPGFTVIAILTLAVGIGANTAIFSFVNTALLRPLPYPHADRLAVIWSGVENTNRAPASNFELFQIRQRTKQFDEVAGIWVTNGALPKLSEQEHVSEQVKVGVVTSDFLPLFSVKPELGRFFTHEDEASDATVLIISYGVWVRRFGSSRSIIGRPVRFGRGSAVIVGVLPENFRLIFPADSNIPSNVDVFRAIPISPSDPKGPAFLELIGLLHSGSNVARAQAEADAIATHIHAFDGRLGIANFRLSVVGLQADDVRTVRNTLLLLFGGVAFVLLIGCVNIANLLMVRARQRLGETITRAALGASSGRLVRQLLTESVLLGSIGALAALAIAWVAVHGMLAACPPSLLNFSHVKLDGKVLAFTLIVALVTSLLFGFAPVLSVRRLDLARNLREASRRATGSNKRQLSGVLVAAEVALALVLLLGTGLLMRTFVNLLRAQPGFRAANVFTFRISGSTYQMLRQLEQNLAGVPGVQSVAAVSHLPLDDKGNWYDTYWKEGATAEAQNIDMADLRCILPGYFSTIGATLLRGRDFVESDDAAHEHVAIVDDVLARELWPHGDAIGQKINVSDSPKGPYEFERDWLVIVGVVKHVQCHSLAVMVRPQIYMPFQLAPRPTMAIVIHTRGIVPGLAASVRKQVALLNKDVAVSNVAPLYEVVARALSESRFASLLASVLSGVALLLACIGVYGVLSYSVAQRTSEIGIRIAIGARRAQVMRMVLIDGLSAVLLGITGGFLLSLEVTPLLAGLLYGVRPNSPANYAVVLMIVLLVSGLAAFVPAYRAMKVDPLIALRYE